ncbi:MAG: carboxypeptidase regulatory-like domain-containing protein, partial [Vicinamibacterales bacterium]
MRTCFVHVVLNIKRRCFYALTLTPLIGGWSQATAQGTGSITGRVTDAASGVPVAAARVYVTGSSVGTQTSDNGRFSLRAIPVGSVDITVVRLGYVAKRSVVTVTAAQPTTLDVALTQVTYSLAEVVTTVTGQQRKVELGNAIATINVADKLADAPVKDISGLLLGRAAGIQVVQSGATGSGSRIRIRGQGSLSLSNEPLVYIDGVRVMAEAGSMSIGVG